LPCIAAVLGELPLGRNKPFKDFVPDISPALQQLSKLTALHLTNIVLQQQSISCLPVHLQVLDVMVAVSKQGHILDFRPLNELRELCLSWLVPAWRGVGDAAVGDAVLPPSVTGLVVLGFGSAQLPAKLEALQVDTPSMWSGVLGQLCHAKHLDELHVTFSVTNSLSIYLFGHKDQRFTVNDDGVLIVQLQLPMDVIEDMCAGLATSTQLTMLGLDDGHLLLEIAPELLEAVQQLTGLQVLAISTIFPTEMLLQLPLQQLTNVSCLLLAGDGTTTAVDEATFTAISTLPKLAVLVISDCATDLTADAVLPAMIIVMTALTGLTEVELFGNKVPNVQTLLQDLTSLTDLG
jgi:hypothetical protein